MKQEEVLSWTLPYDCEKCKKRYVVGIPFERLEKQGQGLVSKEFLEKLKTPNAEKVSEMKAWIRGWEAEGRTFINVGLREAFQCEECDFVVDMDEVITEMSKIAKKWESK